MEIKTTAYFTNEVLRKRPYINIDWCKKIVDNPTKTEKQPDGRIRHWGYVPEFGTRALRVITLSDGVTLHNAFPDRDFKR